MATTTTTTAATRKKGKEMPAQQQNDDRSVSARAPARRRATGGKMYTHAEMCVCVYIYMYVYIYIRDARTTGDDEHSDHNDGGEGDAAIYHASRWARTVRNGRRQYGARRLSCPPLVLPHRLTPLHSPESLSLSHTPTLRRCLAPILRVCALARTRQRNSLLSLVASITTSFSPALARSYSCATLHPSLFDAHVHEIFLSFFLQRYRCRCALSRPLSFSRATSVRFTYPFHAIARVGENPLRRARHVCACISTGNGGRDFPLAPPLGGPISARTEHCPLRGRASGRALSLSTFPSDAPAYARPRTCGRD